MAKEIEMKIKPAVIALATAIVVAGCGLFTATSYFYVDNRSTQDVAVTWTTSQGQNGAKAIPASTRLHIATGTLIESDVVLPSQYFVKLNAVYAGSSAQLVNQDPIRDADWARTSGSKSKSFVFDLVIP